jgi:hypothetical protein
MTTSDADRKLIDLVQQQINSGSRQIVLPGHLVNAASEAVLDEIRRLCKLNGVSVEIRM